ncbi:MAG TPA: DUF4334 domain-containing protein [Kofleriaceae bacterium]|nr:DUF4334 domain-containing protein [Kofleriaceae bacterium]
MTAAQRLATIDSVDDALSYFDSLPAVRAADIRGRYRGSELRTGHPMEGKLAAAGWYGKQFDDADRVHPLLFTARDGGEVFAIDPRKLPFVMAGQRLPTWTASAGRRLLPALKTTKPRARLRELEHRGVVTAAMIYDHQPIIDMFRRIDDDTLLGFMDLRRQPQPYFFVLTRER